MSINRTERHRGRWRFAGDEGAFVPGVLVIDPDGRLSLELSGSLCRESSDELMRGSYRIVGELETFSSVSLNGCFVRSTNLFSPAPSQVWHVHEVIFGVAFSAEEPWAFYDVRAVIPGLTCWVRRKTTESIEEFNEDGSVKRIGVSVQLQSWPLWNLDQTRVDLATRAGARQRSEAMSEVEASVVLRVRSPELIDWRQLHEIATRPVQALLGLATGHYTAMTHAEVTVAGVTPGERIAKLAWHWQPLTGALKPERVRYAFTYSDLSALGETALDTAMRRLGSVDPVLDLYLASLRELSYAELSFNVVMQALETYHRSRHADQVVPDEHWPSLKDALTKAITDTLARDTSLKAARETLCQRLAHFNEPSLRQRLKALLARIEPSTTAVCGDAKRFIQAVVDTRNYYTHWSPSLATKALRGGAAVHVTSRLRALLEILLLRDVGFAADSPAERAVLHRRISWLPERSE